MASLKNDKPAEGMPNLLVIETNLMDGPFDSWCVDSGTISYICNMSQGFKETRRLKEGEVILKMGTGATVAATAIGTFYLELSSSRTLVLEDCLYVSEVRRNLVSVSKLVCLGYSFLFTSKLVVKFNNKLAANLRVARDNYFYVGFIKFFFTI